MRNNMGAHDVLFHYMRDDVILGTVYWDAVDAGPPRATGWFFVPNGSEVHHNLGQIHRTDHDTAVLKGYQELLRAPEFELACSPAESLDMLFWCEVDDDGNEVPPTLELTPFDVELDEPGTESDPAAERRRQDAVESR